MTAIPNSLVDYLDDLNGAKDAEDCVLATQRHVAKVGFQNVVFAYTHRPLNIEGKLPSYLRHSTICKTWEERYHEMGYQNHCPLYREGLRGGPLPLIWQQAWDRQTLTVTQKRVIDEAAGMGLRQGFSVAIAEQNGDSSGIGISTELGPHEAGQLIAAHLPDLFLMIHHLHAAIVDNHLDQSEPRNIPRLTARELDCLYWVSAGKGTWEISAIHQISSNTVKYHLRNVLAKLNVPTRAAAVARAYQLGLLSF